MSWAAKLCKADQAGLRMFKAIMTGGAIGIVGREIYVQTIWVSLHCVHLFVCIMLEPYGISDVGENAWFFMQY